MWMSMFCNSTCFTCAAAGWTGCVYGAYGEAVADTCMDDFECWPVAGLCSRVGECVSMTVVIWLYVGWPSACPDGAVDWIVVEVSCGISAETDWVDGECFEDFDEPPTDDSAGSVA